MGRIKTQDLPDLSTLLVPQNELMLAVEQAVLRNRGAAGVAASLAEQIAAKLAGVITLGHVDSGQRLLEQDADLAVELAEQRIISVRDSALRELAASEENAGDRRAI